MQLRSRLFLWISGVLICAGGVSYVTEGMVTKRELKIISARLKNKIEALNEEKRKQVVRFVAAGLQEIESRMDMLLERLSTYPLQAAAFAPTDFNIQHGTWVSAAELLVSYPWIDFIQNTYNQQVLSFIVPTSQTLYSTARAPLQDELAWIMMGDHKYLGIQIHFHAAKAPAEGEKIQTSQVIPAIYFLFDPQASLPTTLSPEKIAVPWLDGAELDTDRFQASLLKAKEYLSSQPEPAILSVADTPFKPNWIERYDMRYLIWGLSVMHQEPKSPLGVALYLDNSLTGEGIFAQEVFWHQPTAIPASNQTVDFQVDGHVYLGKRIEYHVKAGENMRTGDLTIGVDTESMVEKLQLALNQETLLVHGGQIVPSIEHPPEIAEMLKQNSGVVQWRGKDFYFMQVTPQPELDLHFFLLNPVEVEFALLTNLIQGTQKVAQDLLNNIHLIGLGMFLFTLIILHYLARRITDPIAKLARVTSHVGEGRLKDLDIPLPDKDETDEIASLCHSFHQMVIGLQEKEKVKAVLNKVVSQEIAQEILKGHVHLGGEEKKVTVLFADIRQFTQMTQNMDPQAVIELLNGCMTELSHVVDRFGGVIDKYVGDEVMALFGAPVEQADSAWRAVSCALQMRHVLTEWNYQRAQAGQLAVQVGIGIHTGKVLAGNMGAENRLNYTVLGSNVNLAARLCSAAGPMEILISDQTYQEPSVQELGKGEALPPMHLKGFNEAVVVYRIT